MAVEITMPKMGLTMTTGIVGEWLKKVGDPVAKGETLVEVTTEKIVNSVESPVDGVLLQIVAEEGEELPIGGLMGLVGDASEMGVSAPAEARAAAPAGIQAAAPAEAKATAPVLKKERAAGGKIKITPVAAKMAREKGIDVASVEGTGPNGRITKEDIERVLAAPAQQAAPATAATAASAEAEYEAVPYDGMRRAVGENMKKSWNQVARVTHHVRADASELLALRKKINEDIDPDGKVTVTDMLLKIAASALRLHPEFNVTKEGDEIRRHKEIRLGFAVALDNGLIVPVVRNADRLSVLQIARETKRLAGLAKANKLGVKDFTGSTFTLTNIGGYRSVDFFTPIVNLPEALILGVGRTVEMPVAVDGNVVIRPMMGLSLSFDHVVIDGAPAAVFLATLLKLIENPVKGIL